MEKLKIFIAEDDVFISEQLSDILIELGYEVVGIGYHYDSAVEILRTKTPDIAILDIKMHGKDEGFSIAKHINDKLKIPFVFLTSFSDKETLQQAVDMNPAAYLVKPFTKSHIFSTLTLIQSQLDKNIQYITIKQGWEKVKIKTTTILWVEKDDKHLKIQTKTNTYFHRSTIKEFLNQVSEKQFKRTHRSYVVNVMEISKLSANFVTIKNTKIPLSRNYKDQLFEDYESL